MNHFTASFIFVHGAWSLSVPGGTVAAAVAGRGVFEVGTASDAPPAGAASDAPPAGAASDAPPAGAASGARPAASGVPPAASVAGVGCGWRAAGPGAGRAAGCPTTAVCGIHGLFEEATDEERDCHHNSDARGIGRARSDLINRRLDVLILDDVNQ
jgi:hypothetical protein